MTTEEALEASIVHWKENELADDPRNASCQASDCALCQMFNTWAGCDGCPVKAETHHDWCAGSPYRGADRAWSNWYWQRHNPNSWNWLLARTQFRNAARAERRFLEGLRKKGEA